MSFALQQGDFVRCDRSAVNGPLRRLCTKNHSNKNVHAVEDNLNSDLDNATTWFIQNCKPGKVSGYCMVLERTEDKLLFKSGNIDVKTTEKLTPWGLYSTVS